MLTEGLKHLTIRTITGRSRTMATVGSDGKEGNDTGSEGKEGSDTGKENSDTGKEASDPLRGENQPRASVEQGLLEGVPAIPRSLVRIDVAPTSGGATKLLEDPVPDEQEQSTKYWSLVEGFGILNGYIRESGLGSSLILSVSSEDEARSIVGNDPLVQTGLMEITAIAPFA